MKYKMLFWATLIIPFGLSASEGNDKSKKTVVAWLGNVSPATQDKCVGTSTNVQQNKSVGTYTGNDRESNPLAACFDGIIRMQEKTASLYQAQNQMLGKLAENQENFHQEIQALRDENDNLKQRIIELEKHKK